MAHVHLFGGWHRRRGHHPPGSNERLRGRQRRSDPAPRSSHPDPRPAGALRRGTGGFRAPAPVASHTGLHPLPAGSAHDGGQAGNALDAGSAPRHRRDRVSAEVAPVQGLRAAPREARRPSSTFSTATPPGSTPSTTPVARHELRAPLPGERPRPTRARSTPRSWRRSRAPPRPLPRWVTICACFRILERWRSPSKTPRSAPRRCPTSATRCARNGFAPSPATDHPVSRWRVYGRDPVAGTQPRRFRKPGASASPTPSSPSTASWSVENVSSGLVVHEAVIRRSLDAQLPFMATESILMRATRGGGDRQALHERIRRHAHAATRKARDEGGDPT